ncbi:MAG: hypothetical protein U0W24_24580 [Bacteroidales bacterium]
MIDFFAEIFFDNQTSILNDNLFSKQKVYSNISYIELSSSFKNCKIIWTNKPGKEENVSENDEFFCLVYGYCFTRLDSNLEIGKKRLFSNDLIFLYQKFGKKITDHIKGSYSLFIFDKENQEAVLITDKFNINNVYYSYNNERLLISSSLGAFCTYSPHEFGKINIKSVIEYHLFDFDLVNECFIEGIKSVPSASCYSFSKNKTSYNNYWDIFDAFSKTSIKYSEDEAIEKVEDLMKKNLELYISHPKETAFALTGGYDSRTNLALLGHKKQECFFYSYGLEKSYDIRLPVKIAKKLNLNFKPFYMDQNFANNFDKSAEIAILMGDGNSEMNRANYVYVFKEFFTKYNFILTGLFGSELIKRPTSLGGYIDRNVRDILLSQDLDSTLDKIFLRANEENFINNKLLDEYKDQIKKDIQNNRFLTNQFQPSLKFFFFITGIGNCKYFMKEIKTERAFVENLHPYLDIEFIELLLQTPFPWVYNWENKKSLLRNLKIHKFYGALIHRNNKKLSNIISTHGYKPKYLLSKIWLPFLIFQYFILKRKINKIGIFKNEDLCYEFYRKRSVNLNKFSLLFNNSSIEKDFIQHMKDFTKLSSLQIWMYEYNVNL